MKWRVVVVGGFEIEENGLMFLERGERITEAGTGPITEKTPIDKGTSSASPPKRFQFPNRNSNVG